MIVLPLRCYTYPGTTAWHEYGHKFSWRMKLRTKQCFADFFVYQPYSTRYQRAFRVPVEKVRFSNSNANAKANANVVSLY